MCQHVHEEGEEGVVGMGQEGRGVFREEGEEFGEGLQRGVLKWAGVWGLMRARGEDGWGLGMYGVEGGLEFC